MYNFSYEQTDKVLCGSNLKLPFNILSVCTCMCNFKGHFLFAFASIITCPMTSVDGLHLFFDYSVFRTLDNFDFRDFFLWKFLAYDATP